MNQLIIFILLLPFLGFIINGLGAKKISRNLAGIIGSGTVLASFILSVIAFNGILQGSLPSSPVSLFTWIEAGNLRIPFSFLVDRLSVLMMMIITGVGFLIHVYSIGYMKEDDGFGKYFSYLNLFTFSMLLLVMGSNFVVMFIGWEGVGLCSYLLIGFWFKNNAYNNAASKAFIMNRIGDLGFLLGIFLIYHTFGTLEYSAVFEKAKMLPSGDSTLLWITLFLFIGATGKSAQIPLYTWLPDAMAGPTPVSALIHAATMVTAGIYMIVRSNIMFTLAPFTMGIISIVGLLTALTAALIAISQTDIKKVLAYSTVSQLGYMFLALGVGGYSAAMFHLMTHAFFKALLFLGAGSVIHAMSGEQDIRNMGGLKKYTPITFITFFTACLAISGIPPFSGFFSKDEILAHVYASNPILWIFAVIGAMMTAFYMFRLLYLVFYRDFKGSDKQLSHLHESPYVMTIPLIVLAILSFAGGFINIPESLGGTAAFKHYLDPILEASNQMHSSINELSHQAEYVLMAISICVVVLSILFARQKYYVRGEEPAMEKENLPMMVRLTRNKFYIDEIYEALVVKPIHLFGDFLLRFIEKLGIDRLVNGIGNSVIFSSKNARLLQTGNTGFYLFAMVFGIIIILLFNLIR